MSLLLTVSISILVVGVIILLIAFPLLRKSLDRSSEVKIHSSIHDELFYE